MLPLPIFTGFVTGYIWFLLMHHWLHHIDLRERTWLHRYAIWVAAQEVVPTREEIFKLLSKVGDVPHLHRGYEG